MERLDRWASRRGGWSEGRYRFRTHLRRRLPFALLRLSPKGTGDCGNHQWYNADDVVEQCYHCEAERLRRPEWLPRVRRAAGS